MSDHPNPCDYCAKPRPIDMTDCVRVLWQRTALIFCAPLCAEAFFRSKRKREVRG